jgi:hypothetical protein
MPGYFGASGAKLTAVLYAVIAGCMSAACSVLDLPTCEEERDMHGAIMFRVRVHSCFPSSIHIPFVVDDTLGCYACHGDVFAVVACAGAVSPPVGAVLSRHTADWHYRSC